jgi:hypothetical protein
MFHFRALPLGTRPRDSAVHKPRRQAASRRCRKEDDMAHEIVIARELDLILHASGRQS